MNDLDSMPQRMDEMAEPDLDGLPAAQLVVSPPTLEDAGFVFRYASEHGLSCLIWGGGTHQGYGYEVESDVVVTTRGLNRIIAYEVEDLTIVVEAGTTVRDLCERVEAHGQVALLPEAATESTVGGVIAAGLSSWQRARYGPTRDRVLETELVTGDGRVIRAGGRLVKNVTGFDIPRLAVGSFGSLGMIGTVCLKLWPKPVFTATVSVPDAGRAARIAYRPLAVIETTAGTKVYLGGTEPDVTAQANLLGGDLTEGLDWPQSLDADHRFSLRVPAGMVPAAVDRIRSLGFETFQASHGVGEVNLALDEPDAEALSTLRDWVEPAGGSLVTVAGGPAEFDPWGAPPSSLELQRVVVASFDPAGIANPGRLPGRL